MTQNPINLNIDEILIGLNTSFDININHVLYSKWSLY